MSRVKPVIARWIASPSLTLAQGGAVLISVCALAACGESAQDKAKADVCAARTEISKQITKLQGLTLSSSAVNEAKSSVELIGKELKKMKDAQPNLDSARKQQVGAATKTFEDEFKKIASEVTSTVSSGSLSSSLAAAGPKLKSAVTALASSYRQALAPINCS
jgi:Tfp pilus assembly protein PilP